MKKVYLFILCGCIFVTATGCGTVKGIGEDISSMGHWVSKSADNVSKGGAKAGGS